MEVKITFRTPAREGGHGGSTIHERILDAVPRAKAEQMAEDFVQYRSAANGRRNGAGRSELYRYTKNGEEVIVALDFGEIVALTASGDHDVYTEPEHQ
jgi:hypothetical protein